jgi:heterodisulfide reductase subunit C
MSIYMDHTPRQIIAMTRAGFKDEVLASNTIWLCASCYSCTIDCPKQIKVTDVMYALKRRAIETKAYPRKFPIPVLAREFFKSVWRTGRSNEGRIVARMWLKTYPLRLLLQAGLGLKLLLRGRILIRTERMEGDPDQMRRLLEAVEKKRSTLTVR